MYSRKSIYLANNPLEEKQILFTAYVKNKKIKLTKKEIKQIFNFFEEKNENIIFLKENVKLYKPEKKFSDLAKKNLKIYIEKFKHSIKDGNPKGKRLIDFVGKEHKGFRDIAAINKLLETGEGFVPEALERDYFGKITLVWGQEFMGGLSHIIARRKYKNKLSDEEIEKFLLNIPDIIKRGKIRYNNDTEKYEISKGNKILIIDILTEDSGIKFLLSGFKKTEKEKR